MTETAPLILDLFILFVAAKVFGEIAERLGQPAMVGELIAGVIVGPYVLGWVGLASPLVIEAFHGDAAAAAEGVRLVESLVAELGVIVLLFYVGLETRAADLFQVGRTAVVVAILGVVVPFLVGIGVGGVIGLPAIAAVFLGTALVATSIGATARVLGDLNVIRTIEARVILGAAVIDDILGLIILAVVSGIAVSGSIDLATIGVIALQAFAFVTFLILVGTGIARRYALHLNRLRIAEAPFVVAMTVMLGLAALATQFGLAAIIGAFLAGMVFAEAREHFELEAQTKPVYAFLVPFFFAGTGTALDPRLFLDPGTFVLAIVVTVIALLTKVVGCGVGTLSYGPRSALTVGVGMAPRGEVGLIVASIGRGLGVIPDTISNVVIVMSILTTILAPPLLRLLYRNRLDHAHEADLAGSAAIV